MVAVDSEVTEMQQVAKRVWCSIVLSIAVFAPQFALAGVIGEEYTTTPYRLDAASRFEPAGEPTIRKTRTPYEKFNEYDFKAEQTIP